MMLKNENDDEIEMCKGVERYSMKWIIGQNLFIIIYFSVGFIGLYSLQINGCPVLSIFYAIFIIVMILIVLRKHPCSDCYYYGKRCNTGWAYFQHICLNVIQEIMNLA